MAMELKPILSKTEYDAALREVSAYFGNEATTGATEAARFETLVTLIEAYEAKHYPMPNQQENIRKPGALKDKIRIAADFDLPLSDDVQAAFKGK
jgi:antitoxin component HigA of HigAB toxin-antitoxin module